MDAIQNIAKNVPKNENLLMIEVECTEKELLAHPIFLNIVIRILKENMKLFNGRKDGSS